MWEKGNCADKDCEISQKWRPKERERVGISLKTKKIKRES